MLNLVDDLQRNKPLVLNSNFVQGFKRILCDSSLDKVCFSFSSTIIHFVDDGFYHMISFIVLYAFLSSRNLWQRQ